MRKRSMESNSLAPQTHSASCELSSAQLVKVIWVGPTTGGLGWLSERIKRFQSPQTPAIELRFASLNSADDLRHIVEVGGDRLIFAVRNRLDYPQNAIRWLSANAPELPISLATDTWWDGARRTGLGAQLHLVMPWHRWWDGWVDWLEASSAELFGPAVLPMTYGMEKRRTAITGKRATQNGKPSRGWVVAHCAHSAEAWSLVAQQAGALVERCSPNRILDASWQEQSTVEWLLWDDSCLATCKGNDEVAQGVQFIEAARRMFPNTPIYCAFTMPRWSVWDPMLRAGANEMLTKPNTGRGLQQLLGRW